MSDLELFENYWKQYFKDYLSCYDSEKTIDEKTLNEMLLDLQNSEKMWEAIDYAVAELLVKHKAIL